MGRKSDDENLADAILLQGAVLKSIVRTLSPEFEMLGEVQVEALMEAKVLAESVKNRHKTRRKEKTSWPATTSSGQS